ncbi:MAG: nucleotidyl transferase AbiEii/AbiGii toxin family protein [Planctomycetes bacterium]|nr:nucleotidyl transferase AbiEii/AbiGii toxin family protein [Planctomycetota bacterium]
MIRSLEDLAAEASRLDVPLSMVVKSELGRAVLVETAALAGLVLQGGGALHHCHGSPRYSADLDLVEGEGFDAEALGVALERAAGRLGAAWGEVEVSGATAHGRLSRQKLRVALRPGTVLVLAIERYAVAVHRPEVRPLLGADPAVQVAVEAPEELMADKLVAAIDRWRARGSVKLRDVYDLDRLSRLAEPDASLVIRKLEDYGLPLALGALGEVAGALGPLAAEDLMEQLRGVLPGLELAALDAGVLLARVRSLVERVAAC